MEKYIPNVGDAPWAPRAEKSTDSESLEGQIEAAELELNQTLEKTGSLIKEGGYSVAEDAKEALSTLKLKLLGIAGTFGLGAIVSEALMIDSATTLQDMESSYALESSSSSLFNLLEGKSADQLQQVLDMSTYGFLGTMSAALMLLISHEKIAKMIVNKKYNTTL
jgi:hypothetical protein